MALLLIPPSRRENSRGFLWWRKKEVEFDSIVLEQKQTRGAIAGLVQSLEREYKNRKSIHQITVRIVGDLSCISEGHRQLTARLEDNKVVKDWLYEMVPLCLISLEHEDDGPVKGFSFETIKGARKKDVVFNIGSLEIDEDFVPRSELIVPRVKNIAFSDAISSVAGPSDNLPIVEPFIADLCVTYAFDGGGIFRSLNSQDLTQLSISSGDLRELAIENLRSQCGKFEIEELEGLQRVLVGNDMEASLLLFDEVWRDIQVRFKKELVVAVPTRNELAFAALGADSGLEALRDFVETSFSCEPTHGLTQHLLIRREDRWEIFE